MQADISTGSNPTLSPAHAILVINSGSSSLKAALFVQTENAGGEKPVLQANATGIGQTEGTLSIKDAEGKALGPSGGDKHDYKSQAEALERIAENLGRYSQQPPSAIGHRIVHGGMHLTRHQRLTPAIVTKLKEAVHFAPLHIPGSLELIRIAEKLYPGIPQFACFDTAFHQTLPETAWRLPIPREYAKEGVRRYGFHGLSYESIVAQLRRESAPLPDRIIIAHLGSGSSLAAIRRGESVDTSMGFTPTGGVPMATRTGDLDPGVIIFMMRTGLRGSGSLSLDQVEALVNHQSGLTALSGGISDMQKLEAAAQQSRTNEGAGRVDPAHAALAVRMFAIAIAKTVASYIVSLEGLDTLVFTGGIGEHAASFRSAVVDRLEPLGFKLDVALNQSHAPIISAAGSRVIIRILPAEEDQQIARHVRTMLSHG